MDHIEKLKEFIETSDLDDLQIKWLLKNIDHMNEEYRKKFGGYISI